MARDVETGYSGWCIDVEAPARLHLGFLDLHGGMGRRFGSIGLTIDSLATRLQARRSDGFSATGPGAERALEYARAFAAARGIGGGISLTLEQAIPDHVGLGSGTQMALAVGTALERLYDIESGSRSIADTLQRGARSGIGIGAFDQGGFILDCGRGELEGVPPVAVRLPFPGQWRILLLFDIRGQGLHGEREREGFSSLPEFPENTAGHLCRLVMMKLLPGLLEQSLPMVADAIGEIQQLVGDYFAPAQGGRFTSTVVSDALAWIKRRGLSGIGQSSWGPTGFVLVENTLQAQRLERGLKQHFGELTPLRCQRVAARNHGATLKRLQALTRLREEKRTK